MPPPRGDDAIRDYAEGLIVVDSEDGAIRLRSVGYSKKSSSRKLLRWG